MSEQSKRIDYFTHWPAICLLIVLGLVIFIPFLTFVSSRIVSHQPTPAHDDLTSQNENDRSDSKQSADPKVHHFQSNVPWTDEAYARERLFGNRDRSQSQSITTGSKPKSAKKKPAEYKPIAHKHDPRIVTSMSSEIRPRPPFDDEFWAPLTLMDEEDLRRDLEEFATPIDLAGRDGFLVTPQDVQLQIRRGVEARENSEPMPFSRGIHPIKKWLVGRSDLEGLPFRIGDHVRLNQQAASMAVISRKIGSCLEKIDGNSMVPSVDQELAAALSELELPKNDLAARLLHEMLQGKGQAVRLHLVDRLSDIQGGVATDALAKRAMFDLSIVVRQTAVNALHSRPRLEFYPQLVDGTQYPWPPIANHAAAALVALDVEEAIESLAVFENATDPAMPFFDDYGQLYRVELVKINHGRNCFLCHAPSTSDEDRLRARTPIPNRAIPTGIYDVPVGSMAIRADTTYLKHDFSVTILDPSHRPWPEDQRHDYLVRQRRFSPHEQLSFPYGKNHAQPYGENTTAFPQRAAIQFALKKLARPKKKKSD